MKIKDLPDVDYWTGEYIKGKITTIQLVALLSEFMKGLVDLGNGYYILPDGINMRVLEGSVDVGCKHFDRWSNSTAEEFDIRAKSGRKGVTEMLNKYCKEDLKDET